MIVKSPAFDAAIVADSRRLIPRAVFDLIDPDAVVESVTVSGETHLSRTEQTVSRGQDETEEVLLSLERSRWLLDGRMRFPPEAAADRQGQVGWEGDVLSGDDGAFSAPYPWLEQEISDVNILQAVTLQFSQHEENGVPTELLLEIWSGDTAVERRTVYPDPKERFCAVEGLNVYAPTRLRVTVLRWSLPGRFPRLVRFMMGLYEEWSGNQIALVDIYTEVTFSGLAIPYSSCTLVVHNENNRFDPYAPNSIFRSIEDRQALKTEIGTVLADGAVEYLPAGTWFQQSGGWALKDLTIEWKLVDIIGMLVQRKFVVPDPLPETLSGWLTALVGSLGINFQERYTVDADVADLPLTAAAEDVDGKTCGEILRYLCMATNTWPRQEMSTGFLRVGKITRTEGNAITRDNMSAYPTMEANDDIADLTFTLDEGSVTFPGTNTNSETSLVVDNPFVHTAEDARTAAISCFFEYGGRFFQVLHRGNPSSEPGDLQSVDTRFETTLSARLYKQQLKLDKGVMRRVPSYLIQSPNDAVYQNKIILTGAGTWTAPAGVTAIKITAVGAGSGGQGGRGGEMLYRGESNRYSGGRGGAAGRVYIVEVSINDQQSFDYTCGTGGRAGTAGDVEENGGAGGTGGVTTFGPHSSANGRDYPNGLMDIQSGTVYAQAGPSNGRKPALTYGSGGAGGRNGRDGLIVETTDENGVITEAVAREPEPGAAGTAGMEGCVIIEY